MGAPTVSDLPPRTTAAVAVVCILGFCVALMSLGINVGR